MAVLSSTTLSLGNQYYAASRVVLEKGFEVNPQLAKFFSVLAGKKRLRRVPNYLVGKKCVFGVEAMQAIASNGALSSTSTSLRTQVQGSLSRRGIPLEFDSNEIPDKGQGGVVIDRVTQGMSDIITGLESELFSNGDGSSDTIIGLCTWLPMADTGAVCNIPATRSDFTSGIYHYWCGTASCGSRVQTLLGAGHLITDFCDPDTGLLATLDACVSNASSRGYFDWYAFCTDKVGRYLKRYLTANGMLQASMVPGEWMPSELKLKGMSFLAVGGSYIRWNDINFIPTSDIYDTDYDIIALPMTSKSGETMEICYTVPNVEGLGKLAQKEVMFTLWPFQRATLAVGYEAPFHFIAQLFIWGLSGCVALKSNGVYDALLV